MNEFKDKLSSLDDIATTVKIVQIVLPIIGFLLTISLVYKYGKWFKKCFC